MYVVANSAVCGLVVLWFHCVECAQLVDATSMVWGGVGWGGDVNVMFMLRWCYVDGMGYGVGWGVVSTSCSCYVDATSMVWGIGWCQSLENGCKLFEHQMFPGVTPVATILQGHQWCKHWTYASQSWHTRHRLWLEKPQSNWLPNQSKRKVKVAGTSKVNPRLVLRCYQWCWRRSTGNPKPNQFLNELAKLFGKSNKWMRKKKVVFAEAFSDPIAFHSLFHWVKRSRPENLPGHQWRCSLVVSS